MAEALPQKMRGQLAGQQFTVSVGDGGTLAIETA